MGWRALTGSAAPRGKNGTHRGVEPGAIRLGDGASGECRNVMADSSLQGILW